MSASVFPRKDVAAVSDSAGWHSLYHAALFETDVNMISERIAVAEKAVLARMKELFGESGDHIEEDLILDDALYALRSLRNCINHGSLAA